jgi:hypothetical protein
MRGLNLRWAITLLVVASGALLGGCGGPPPPPSLSVEELTSSVESSPGSEVSLNFKLASTTGYNGEVTYALLENNQRVTWATLSPEREQVSIPKNGRRPTSLRVRFANDAPTGEKTLSLQVVYQGGQRKDTKNFRVNLVPPQRPDIRVEITPQTVALRPGQKATFTATVHNATNPAVTWSASGGVLEAQGNTATFTMPLVFGERTDFTVTATSVEDPTKTASARITWKMEEGQVIVEPEFVLFERQGEAVRLRARVVRADGTEVPNAQVTWSSSNPAAFAVDPDGTVRALGQVGDSAIIMATYQDFLAGFATVAMASLKPGAKRLQAEMVLAVDLPRDLQDPGLIFTQTFSVDVTPEAGTRLAVGDRLLVPALGNLLPVEVKEIQQLPDRYRLQVTLTPLTEVFERLEVRIAPDGQFRTQMVRRSQALYQMALQERWAELQSKSSLCKNDSGGSIALDFISPPVIQMEASFAPFVEAKIEGAKLLYFRLGLEGLFRILKDSYLTRLSLSASANVTLGFKCEVPNLPKIPIGAPIGAIPGLIIGFNLQPFIEAYGSLELKAGFGLEAKIFTLEEDWNLFDKKIGLEFRPGDVEWLRPISEGQALPSSPKVVFWKGETPDLTASGTISAGIKGGVILAPAIKLILLNEDYDLPLVDLRMESPASLEASYRFLLDKYREPLYKGVDFSLEIALAVTLDPLNESLKDTAGSLTEFIRFLSGTKRNVKGFQIPAPTLLKVTLGGVYMKGAPDEGVGVYLTAASQDPTEDPEPIEVQPGQELDLKIWAKPRFLNFYLIPETLTRILSFFLVGLNQTYEVWLLGEPGGLSPVKLGEARVNLDGEGQLRIRVPDNLPNDLVEINLRAFNTFPFFRYASNTLTLSLANYRATLQPSADSVSAGPGATLVRSFEVTNLSNVPLYYNATLQGDGSVFQITRGDSGILGPADGLTTSRLLTKSRSLNVAATCPEGVSDQTYEGVLVVRFFRNQGDPNPVLTRRATLSLACKDENQDPEENPPIQVPDPVAGNEPGDTPPKPPATARSWGDPHLITFDGRAYDFQATGDYILAQSTVPGDPFKVLVRYLPAGGRYSFNLGVATLAGGARVEIFAAEGRGFRIKVNGQERDVRTDPIVQLGGGALLEVRNNRATLSWPDGSSLVVTSAGWFMPNLSLTINGARRGKVEGLLGDADGNPRNDIRIRNGAILDNPREKDLYFDFRQSWRVPWPSPDNLFSEGPDLYDPFYPVNLISIEDLPPERVEWARQICLEEGVVTEDVLLACIFDVAITGEAIWAARAVKADPYAPGVHLRPRLLYVPLDRPNRMRRIGALVTGVQDKTLVWEASPGLTLHRVRNNVVDVEVPNQDGIYEITAYLASRPEIKDTITVVVKPPTYRIWDGGGDGRRFSDCRNWMEDLCPDPDSELFIITSTSRTQELLMDIPTGTAYSLTLEGRANLSGSLALTGGGRLYGDISLSGTLRVGEGSVLTLQGSLQWHSGYLLGPGTFVNQGLLRVVNTSQGKYLCAALRNEGEIRVESYLSFGCSSPNLPGLLTNAQGATLALQVPQGSTYVIYNNRSDNRLANQGSLVKAGTGTFEVQVPLDNQGEVEVREGALYSTGGGRLLGGEYRVAENATMRLAGTWVGGGQGQVQGSLQLWGALQAPEGQEAILNFTGDGLQWHSGYLLGPGTFVNQGLLRVVNTSQGKYLCAALRNEGEIRVESYLSFGCSSPNLPGLLTNAQGATLALQVPQGSTYVIYNNRSDNRLANQGSLVKAGTGTFEVQVPLDNQGEVEVREGALYSTGGGRLLGGEYRVAENATMRLAGTWVGGGQGQVQGSLQLWGALQAPEGQEAILNFTGDGLQWHSGYLLGPGTFVNQGLLRVVNTSQGKYLCAALRNEGEIRVESYLSFGCSSPNLPGLLTNAQGATLALQVPQGSTYVIYNNRSDNRLANQGSLVKAGTGTFEVQVPLDNQGEVEVREGALYSTGGGRLLGGEYRVAENATMRLAGTWVGGGQGQVQGSLQLWGALQAPEGQEAILNFTGDGLQWHSGYLLGPGTFVNQGLLRVVNTSQGKYLCAALRNEGEIRVESYLSFGCSSPNLPGLLTNAQGATLALQVPQGSTYVIYNNRSDNRLANQGSLVKAGTGTFEVQVPLDNQGEVEVREGALYSTGGGRLLGGEYRVAENATMRLAGTWVGGGQGQVQGSLQLWGALQAPEGQEAILNFTGDGLQWHSGYLLGPGTFVNQGLLRVVNTSQGKYLCAALRNEGEIRVESYLSFGCSSPNLPGLLTNAQGATLALQVPQGSTYVIYNNRSDNRLANQGSLVKAGTGTFEVQVPLDNQGTIQVLEGQLCYREPGGGWVCLTP